MIRAGPAQKYGTWRPCGDGIRWGWAIKGGGFMKLVRTAVGSPGRHGSAIPFTCAITLYETAKSRAGIIEIFQWAENSAVLDRSGNAKLHPDPTIATLDPDAILLPVNDLPLACCHPGTRLRPTCCRFGRSISARIHFCYTQAGLRSCMLGAGSG